MIIYVDIDETICRTPKDRDYSKAVPIPERIAKINQLYEEGHEIIYWTARGTGTGILWCLMTKDQLRDWGCKFTSLCFGKPVYDLFIDDRAINSETFFDKHNS